MDPQGKQFSKPRGGDEYARWYRGDAARVLHAETYEGLYHHHRRLRMVTWLLRRLGVRRILDIGCGDGWQANKLIQSGFEVVGADIAPERLRRARIHAPQATGFFAADMRHPPLAEGRLQCIYLGQVLEHLPEPLGVLTALRKALAPGGYLVLDTPCRDNPVDDLIHLSGLAKRYPGSVEWGLQLDPGHVRFLRLQEIRDLLVRAGYTFITSRGAPRLRWCIPRIGNVFARRRGLWKVHDLLEGLLAWIPRYRHAGAIVVCVARRPPEATAPQGTEATARACETG